MWPPRICAKLSALEKIAEAFETIRAGNFTYADVYAVAMAWVDRQKMKARLAAEETQRAGDAARGGVAGRGDGRAGRPPALARAVLGGSRAASPG